MLQKPMLLVPRTHTHLARTLAAVRRTTHQPVTGLAISMVTHHPTTLPANVTGLILTSAQALPALIDFPTALPTYCVGQTTANAAVKKNLAVAHIAHNASLLTAYLSTLPPQHFAHPKAHNAPHLHLPMHTVTPLVAYTTHYLTQFPAATLHQLQNTHPAGVLLFSPTSAKTVANLFTHHHITLPATAYCLSLAVATAWPGPQTKIAACPTLKAMLKLLP